MDKDNLEKIAKLVRFKINKSHWNELALAAQLRNFVWKHIDNRRKIEGLCIEREFYRSVLMNFDRIVETGDFSCVKYIETGEIL